MICKRARGNNNMASVKPSARPHHHSILICYSRTSAHLNLIYLFARTRESCQRIRFVRNKWPCSNVVQSSANGSCRPALRSRSTGPLAQLRCFTRIFIALGRGDHAEVLHVNALFYCLVSVRTNFTDHNARMCSCQTRQSTAVHSSEGGALPSFTVINFAIMTIAGE